MEIVTPHLRVLKASENAQTREEIDFPLKHCSPYSTQLLLLINIHFSSEMCHVRGIKRVALICAEFRETRERVEKMVKDGFKELLGAGL